MKRLFYSFLILIFVASCAQIKSYPVDNNTISSAGFYYALPKTYLNVAVTLEKITTTKGVYSEFAACVGIPQSFMDKIKEGKNYKVKSAVITNNVYLDESKIYQLDVNQKFLNKSQFSIEYAANGELSSTDITHEDQIIPAIITTANIVKDIAGNVSALGFYNEGGTIKACGKLPDYVELDLKRIKDIHTSINTLLEKGPDGINQAQLEYRIKELKSTRDALISKFTKTVVSKAVVVNFEVDPSTIKPKNPIILLNFKKDKGFKRRYTVNPHNSDITITDKLAFHDDSVSAIDTAVELHLVYLDKLVDYTISQNLKSKNDAIGSFYYRIPARAKFKIMVAGDNIGEATLPIPQEGITLPAPSNLKNMTFKLHPGLGSIYSVSGKSGDANFGAIDSLRKTLFTDKNEKTIKELENKIKIRDLKEQLENGTVSTSVEE
jgi:hypothetical protein